MKKPASFHPYAITTVVLWAIGYVLTKIALEHFSALSVSFLRFGVASVVMAVICLVTKMKLPAKRDLPWFAAAGIIGFFLYMIAFNIGTSHVTAATSSVIIASVPVFTALLAAIIFKEKLKTYQWIAIAVEFTGILILTLYGAVFSANVGALWLLFGALFLSSYNLLQRKLTRTYSALQATTYSIFFGTLFLLIFSPSAISELKTTPIIPLISILFMGVFGSAIAYITWSKAFEKAEQTSQVSNYMFFTPFITGILGFLMIGEVPDPSTWIGGAFIIIGAIIFSRPQKAGGEQ